MKQSTQQVRSNLLTQIMAGIAGTVLATAAMAAEAGGANADAGAAANVGGVAEAHMSASGSANSNAQWRNGATRGADRAEQRMSSYGAEMKRSGTTGFDAHPDKAAPR